MGRLRNLISTLESAIPVMCDEELFHLRSVVLREVNRRESRANRKRHEERVRAIADRVI